MVKKVIVLANGAFPKNSDILNMLSSGVDIVCCDGAINDFDFMNIKPVAIVGDLDSISEQLKKKYSEVLHVVSSQDNNDLTKGIHWCIDNGYTDINILGATGKREDHTLANISLLLDYVKRVNVTMISEHGRFMPILKTTTFPSFFGQQVSVFSIDTTTKFTFRGLKYPVEDKVFTSWWQGSLNESLGDNFTIEVNGSGAIIFLQHRSI